MTTHHRPSKRQAIQNALGRLGWHAKNKDVVALLGNLGIEVSDYLVSRVKIDSLNVRGNAEAMLRIVEEHGLKIGLK